MAACTSASRAVRSFGRVETVKRESIAVLVASIVGYEPINASVQIAQLLTVVGVGWEAKAGCKCGANSVRTCTMYSSFRLRLILFSN